MQILPRVRGKYGAKWYVQELCISKFVKEFFIFMLKLFNASEVAI
jgi:hypothetical protein